MLQLSCLGCGRWANLDDSLYGSPFGWSPLPHGEIQPLPITLKPNEKKYTINPSMQSTIIESIESFYYCPSCSGIQCRHCIGKIIDAYYCPQCLQMSSIQTKINTNTDELEKSLSNNIVKDRLKMENQRKLWRRCKQCYACPDCKSQCLSFSTWKKKNAKFEGEMDQSRSDHIMDDLKIPLIFLNCTHCHWTSFPKHKGTKGNSQPNQPLSLLNLSNLAISSITSPLNPPPNIPSDHIIPLVSQSLNTLTFQIQQHYQIMDQSSRESFYKRIEAFSNHQSISTSSPLDKLANIHHHQDGSTFQSFPADNHPTQSKSLIPYHTIHNFTQYGNNQSSSHIQLPSSPNYLIINPYPHPINLLPIYTKYCLHCSQTLIKMIIPKSDKQHYSLPYDQCPRYSIKYTALSILPKIQVRTNQDQDGDSILPSIQYKQWNTIILTITTSRLLQNIHTSINTNRHHNNNQQEGEEEEENSHYIINCIGCNSWIVDEEVNSEEEQEEQDQMAHLEKQVQMDREMKNKTKINDREWGRECISPTMEEALAQDLDNPAILERKSRQVSFIILVMPMKKAKRSIKLNLEIRWRRAKKEGKKEKGVKEEEEDGEMFNRLNTKLKIKLDQLYQW